MTEAIRAPKTSRHLEDLLRIQREEAPPPPIAKLLGFRLVTIELGRSLFEMDAGPQHWNPMGTLHGGVVCDLADIAMGTAMATSLEDEESFTTVDLTAKYFKPVFRTRLRAAGVLVKRTRATGFLECELRDEGDSLVAKVFSTCMVLRGQDARGR